MSSGWPLATAGGLLVVPGRSLGMARAAAAAQEEQRRWLQDYPAAKEKLKCPRAKPLSKDWRNHLKPPSEPAPKLAHVDGSKKDVLTKGTRRDGRPAAKPMQRAGCAPQQKSSNTSQRAALVRPEQPRKSAKLPMGLVPSTNHPTQPRGKLLTSTSDHLNPEKNKKPAPETVTAAPQPRSDPTAPGTPCSLDEGLLERLLCNKENVPAQTSVLQGVHQSDRNNLRNERVLAHRQSSTITSRSAMGPKDRVSSHPAKERLIQDKFRKPLPGSKSVSQKPSVQTRPLQPHRSLTAPAHLLQRKPGAKQEETTTATAATGLRPGVAPVGGLKHHSRPPPQMKRPPMLPLASGRPQGTTDLKSSLKPGGVMQRPVAKGEAGRKDALPARTAPSQRAAPHNQPRSAHGARPQPLGSDSRSKREWLKPELPKASGIQARRVPKTPSAADRKKQLEEWLASKGKTYKRPPMTLLQKNPVKLSWKNVKEKEKQEKPEKLCLEKTNNVLTECLKLIEEGVQAEEVSALLSRVPQAEKFAKFWICKAKLLARSGPFDVTALYKAAVCAGAVPLQELREVVLDILRAADQTSEGKRPEQPVPWEVTTPCPSQTRCVAATPGPTGKPLTSLPPSIKLQVTSGARGQELLEGQDMKFLTPVRRSLRIGGAGSRYPEMLKDHDPVVSSLSELLCTEEEAAQFFFRKNKALPEVAELEGLSVYPPECC